jgi:hypothetical protein
MYFFYLKESGTSDPEVIANKRGKTPVANNKDHLFVLTAVGMHEFHWKTFEIEISKMKFQQMSSIYKSKRVSLQLTDCEVKSTWMRIPHERAKKSTFLHALSTDERTALAETFYAEFKRERLTLFSVVIDKRKLKGKQTQQTLLQTAYVALLDMLEAYMEEFNEKHQGMIVMEKDAHMLYEVAIEQQTHYKTRIQFFQNYKHIVEYPMLIDNRVSNALQLVDLCGYNVYRAFREEDYAYAFFTRMLPYYYKSSKSAQTVLDGLEVLPEDSELKAAPIGGGTSA